MRRLDEEKRAQDTFAESADTFYFTSVSTLTSFAWLLRAVRSEAETGRSIRPRGVLIFWICYLAAF
jgi:hypothetical protein